MVYNNEIQPKCQDQDRIAQEQDEGQEAQP